MTHHTASDLETMPEDLAPQVDSKLPDERGKVFRRAAQFAAMIGFIWIVLYTIDRSLPYIQPGSDLIVSAKIDLADSEVILEEDVPVRLFVFGNSRILAGFQPDLFDAQFGGDVTSFNMGMPGREDSIIELYRFLEAGNRPTHVLLQVPWPGKSADLTWRQWLQQDAKFIKRLFPFRSLVRNFVVFAFQSRSKGGFEAAMSQAKSEVDEALANRGYYFIASQSHFEDDRLPEDYKLETDEPDKVEARQISVDCNAFRLLSELAQKYDFKVVLIPSPLRATQAASAPPVNLETQQQLADHPRFEILGPDYYSYPNRLFSDPKHLNKEGSEIYTLELAKLLRNELSKK